jgi:glycosyltransferase involved in cell wall biosynthesis
MHVAINALFLEPPMGGLETYVRELCGALLALPDAPKLTVYANPQGHAKLIRDAWAADASIVCAPRLGRRGARALSELGPLGLVADRAGVDVIHSVALTGPLASRAARVVTIADVTWMTHPQNTLTQRMWRTLVPAVVRRADEVIAISDYAAREVRAQLPVSASRLHTTLLGSGAAPGSTPTSATELRARFALGDGPLVLNVGQRGGHRNLLRLIDAIAQLRREFPAVALVLPGYSPPELDEPLRAHARALGVQDAIHFVGFVTADDLDGLYRASAAFVMPSLVEGFGLPVLEAMQRGTPVACTRDSAPSEVGGHAAVTFDPLDPAAIAASIRALLTDQALAARLRVDGPARAAAFTWARCAAQTMDVYRRAQG